MTPTPPLLRWLAEKRACVLDELDVAESTLPWLHGNARESVGEAARATARADKLRVDLESLGHALALYDDRIDPTQDM